MPRRPSVRYWASRNAYCCWLKGKQVVLAEGPDDFPSGATYRAAARRFSDVASLQDAEVVKDDNTCRVVCETYLQWIASRRHARTLKLRKRIYVLFTDTLGEVAIKDLTQMTVYKWLDSMREWRRHPGTGKQTRWTDGSVRNASVSLMTAFNWAEKTGLITKNPLRGMEVPEARSRGRHALLGKNPEERKANHAKILAAASPAFRPFIKCLEASGARPGELANATASDFDPKMGAIVYHASDKRMDGEFSHKTAAKGKDRIIFLSGEALTIVTKLAKEHPTGPLFLTGNGRRVHKHLPRGGWTDKEVTNRFRVIKEKVGMPHLSAYSYRHTFATAWLERGNSVEILAELLGNSPMVIRKHYSHLLSDTGNLRRQLEGFRNGAAAETRSRPKASTSSRASRARRP